MPAHLTETTFRGSVFAERNDLNLDTIADDNLQHRIVSFLCARGMPQTEALEVEVKGGAVRVRGRLPDQHARRLCLECCRHVAGVLKLIDELEVESSLQKDASQDSEERINDDSTGAVPKNPR